MRTDGRTDMTKLIVAFRNFGMAPKNDNRVGTELYIICTNLEFRNSNGENALN